MMMCGHFRKNKAVFHHTNPHRLKMLKKSSRKKLQINNSLKLGLRKTPKLETMVWYGMVFFQG